MNCEQAEEMLGVYALDALAQSEMDAMRVHLASCPEHAAKAAELRAVAESLHAVTESMIPPAALRDRLTAAIAETSQSAATPSVDRSDTQPVSIAARRESRTSNRLQWRPAMAFGAIAAALAIVAGGLLAWNISLRNDNGSAAISVVRPLQQDSGATAGYIVLFEGGEATVVTDSMPLLDATQSYQLWSLSEAGEATSLGLMQFGEGGSASADVTFDPASTQRIAITIEPAGGSEQPTTQPLYVAELL